ncbi:MFS transporter [Streptomyces alboflavus]|uniref:MFS transporter n=1 Tax=Streptomyces alboflavus TaxID=67267 RepID=A0A1Z1WMS1_9ACTN|nr:MFS transporter [Streptomyces alboflavus]
MTAEPFAASGASGRADTSYEKFQEVTDARGRVYRIGESDRDILGRPRWTMVVLPWVAMIAISVFEYAFGAAENTLSAAHHWSSSNTFWVLSVWIFFQAGVSFPAGKLREKGILTSRKAMLTGSVLSLLGFVSLSHAPNVAAAMVGFGLLGGIGSGLIYSTCVNMVGKWYPERRGGKTGFVNGGFAYGAVPFIFLFSYGFDTSNYRTVLDLVGFYVLAVTLVAGMFFKDPPKNWWPSDIDPLRPPLTRAPPWRSPRTLRRPRSSRPGRRYAPASCRSCGCACCAAPECRSSGSPSRSRSPRTWASARSSRRRRWASCR